MKHIITDLLMADHIPAGSDNVYLATEDDVMFYATQTPSGLIETARKQIKANESITLPYIDLGRYSFMDYNNQRKTHPVINDALIKLINNIKDYKKLGNTLSSADYLSAYNYVKLNYKDANLIGNVIINKWSDKNKAQLSILDKDKDASYLFDRRVIEADSLEENELLFFPSSEKVGPLAIEHSGTKFGAAIFFSKYPMLFKITGLNIIKCECGGEKANTTHSTWCPKY